MRWRQTDESLRQDHSMSATDSMGAKVAYVKRTVGRSLPRVWTIRRTSASVYSHSIQPSLWYWATRLATIHFRIWFKAKLGKQRKQQHPSPPVSPIPPSAIVAVTVEPRDICERVWTEAYDQARADDQSVVDAYETLLSTWLHENSTGVTRPQSSAVGTSQQNEIPKDVAER
jgi:hypothetical protein